MPSPTWIMSSSLILIQQATKSTSSSSFVTFANATLSCHRRRHTPVPPTLTFRPHHLPFWRSPECRRGFRPSRYAHAHAHRPQVTRLFLGGLSYNINFLPDSFKCPHRVAALLKQSAKFSFIPAIKNFIWALLSELNQPPPIVLPYCDAVADGTRS